MPYASTPKHAWKMRQSMKKTYREIQAARRAIKIAGNSTRCAKALTEQEGKPATRDMVEKWKERGVTDSWILAVEKLTGVPKEKLNGHLYRGDK